MPTSKFANIASRVARYGTRLTDILTTELYENEAPVDIASNAALYRPTSNSTTAEVDDPAYIVGPDDSRKSAIPPPLRQSTASYAGMNPGPSGHTDLTTAAGKRAPPLPPPRRLATSPSDTNSKSESSSGSIALPNAKTREESSDDVAHRPTSSAVVDTPEEPIIPRMTTRRKAPPPPPPRRSIASSGNTNKEVETFCDSNSSSVGISNEIHFNTACGATPVNNSAVEVEVEETDEIEEYIYAPPETHNGLESRGETYFGMHRPKQQNKYNITDDYEQKYPEDAYGEEASENARVWRTYLDEAQKADTEMLESWRDTTDALLVFSGLFSAVVSAFVSQTYTSLQSQPNYTQVTAALHYEQIAILRAMAKDSAVDSVPSTPFTLISNASSESFDRWFNGLWFSSLSFSLATAFFAVLVKQWVRHYVSVVHGTASEQVRIRHFRHLGLERWHVHHIVGLLPMLLHASLFLYFVGLVLFLLPLDTNIACAIIIISGTSFVFYLATVILPIWNPQCPYKTPLVTLLLATISEIHVMASRLLLRIRRHLAGDTSPAHLADPQRTIPTSIEWAERTEVQKQPDEIDAKALSWLYSISSNTSVRNIIVQSIAGLRVQFDQMGLIRKTVDMDVLQLISAHANSDGFPRDESTQLKVERLARSYLRLHPFEGESLSPSDKNPDLTSDVFESLTRAQDNQRLSVLAACVVHPNTNPTEKLCAITRILSYREVASQTHPFVWNRLLVAGMAQHWHTPSTLGWGFIPGVLDRFFVAFEERDPFDPIEAWHMRCAMLFEYLHSVFINDRHCSIEPDTLLNSGFLIKVYAVLATVLDNLVSDPSECTTHVKKGFLSSIVSGLVRICFQLQDVGCIDLTWREGKAMHKLQVSARTVVEKGRSTEEYLDRDDIQACQAIAFYGLSPIGSFGAPCSIPFQWSQELMGSIAQQSGGISQMSACRLTSSFLTGDSQAYHLFCHNVADLSSAFDLQEIECSQLLQFSTAFIEGVLDRSQAWSTGDREHTMNYIFHPNNLDWLLQPFTFIHKPTNGLEYDYSRVTFADHKIPKRLFATRPHDGAWKSVLEKWIKLSREPHSYCPAVEELGWGLAAFYRPFCLFHWLNTNLQKLGVVPAPRDPNDEDSYMLYSYVHGEHLNNIAVYHEQLKKFGIENASSYIREIDGLREFAPYAVPFIPATPRSKLEMSSKAETEDKASQPTTKQLSARLRTRVRNSLFWTRRMGNSTAVETEDEDEDEASQSKTEHPLARLRTRVRNSLLWSKNISTTSTEEVNDPADVV